MGVISGTPTAYGSTTFTVTATDSSSSPQSIHQQFTLVINNVSLSITTTSLPNATAGTAYSAPLEASGGTSPYTWTVATGSTLPGWLRLSGSGTNWKLSGTPTTAGTARFSVTVTDSSSPAQSKTVALSITITAASTGCGSGNEKLLKGQYAFSMSGLNGWGFQATIGSFTADGNGHITEGTVDANGVNPSVATGNIEASGSSYSVGSDNRGCATIQTDFYTFTTRFALTPVASGAATQGAIEEWEPGPGAYIASGQILLQSVPSALPAGTYVLQQTGIYDVTSQYRAAGVGTGTGSGGAFTNGEYDLNVESVHHTYTGVTGTYSPLNSTTGRCTATITLNGVTAHLAAYLVSSSYFIDLTTDTLAAKTFLAIGSGQLQNGSLTLTTGKSLVVYASGLENVEFGVVNVTNSSSFSASLFHDVEGTWTTPTPSSGSCSYQIDSFGRVGASGANCGLFYSGTAWSYPPVFYLTGPNAGVMLGTSDPAVLIGRLQPQQATSLDAGTYSFGTHETPAENVNEAAVGVATLSSGDILSGTIDHTSLASPQVGNQAISAILTVNADGTFSTSNNPGVITGLVISGSQFIEVDGLGSTFPTILVYNAGND